MLVLRSFILVLSLIQCSAVFGNTSEKENTNNQFAIPGQEKIEYNKQKTGKSDPSNASTNFPKNEYVTKEQMMQMLKSISASNAEKQKKSDNIPEKKAPENITDENFSKLITPLQDGLNNTLKDLAKTIEKVDTIHSIDILTNSAKGIISKLPRELRESKSARDSESALNAEEKSLPAMRQVVTESIALFKALYYIANGLITDVENLPHNVILEKTQILKILQNSIEKQFVFSSEIEKNTINSLISKVAQESRNWEQKPAVPSWFILCLAYCIDKEIEETKKRLDQIQQDFDADLKSCISSLTSLGENIKKVSSSKDTPQVRNDDLLSHMDNTIFINDKINQYGKGFYDLIGDISKLNKAITDTMNTCLSAKKSQEIFKKIPQESKVDASSTDSESKQK